MHRAESYVEWSVGGKMMALLMHDVKRKNETSVASVAVDDDAAVDIAGAVNDVSVVVNAVVNAVVNDVDVVAVGLADVADVADVAGVAERPSETVAWKMHWKRMSVG